MAFSSRALLTLFYRLQESVHHVPELRIDMRYFEQSAHLEWSDKVDEPLVDDVAREQFERSRSPCRSPKSGLSLSRRRPCRTNFVSARALRPSSPFQVCGRETTLFTPSFSNSQSLLMLIFCKIFSSLPLPRTNIPAFCMRYTLSCSECIRTPPSRKNKNAPWRMRA